MDIDLVSRFRACITAGAIGDAIGSFYENKTTIKENAIHIFGDIIEEETPTFKITDDTQATLATIEAITKDEKCTPETISKQFLKYFNEQKITGIGSSTLKALTELQMGAHWSQVGRKGEFAAGNGAAMRIAPFAFKTEIDYQQIRDICRITHHNEEAYIGAKCIVIAIREIIKGNFNNSKGLIEKVIHQIPDTLVRDRLIEIKSLKNITEIGKKGNDGYVVNSVPLAIAAASKVEAIGLENMFNLLIEIGGDTDTNCSIAGQIAGAIIGMKGIPKPLLNQLTNLKEFKWIENTINAFLKSEKSFKKIAP